MMNYKPVRKIRIDGDVAHVPLTRGYEAIIDASDVDLVAKWNWSAAIGKSGNVYATRAFKVSGVCHRVYMHRVIMGDPIGFEIDHADGRSLNNRRYNLRNATVSQNAANKKKSSRNTSGFKGVAWHAKCRKWQAAIRKDKKEIYLGLFDRPEDAHSAYVEAAKALHQEFARAA